MSYYRGYDYDDDNYGDEPYQRDRDRSGGYADREERDYRGGSRRDSGYDRRDSGYDRRDSGYDRRESDHEGRRESGGRRERDYEGRRESGGRREGGYGGSREGSFRGKREGGYGGRGGRDEGKFRGSSRGGRGSFSRENGGRGLKRSFGGRDRGSPSSMLEDNWDTSDRHAAMRSHLMETVPENFEENWLCIICPAGKRRILVAASNITQTYNSTKKPDQTFKSCLPSGSPQPNEVMKYNDLTILDTVYHAQKKQYYIIDMLHWKQYPYYDTEAEFRSFFLPEKYSQLKTPTELSENNEYPLLMLEKFPCSEASIEQALKETDYKVEGLLFIKKNSRYKCSDSANCLLLRLDQMEKVLGIPLREGITYTKTSSADAEWKDLLQKRKKLKATRKAAKVVAQESVKKDDIASGSWGNDEVAFSAAYYD